MSRRKKSAEAEESVAASRANGRRSPGPATPEGRERIRNPNTGHGFCSRRSGWGWFAWTRTRTIWATCGRGSTACKVGRWKGGKRRRQNPKRDTLARIGYR